MAQVRLKNSKLMSDLCGNCQHQNCCTEFVESFVFPTDIPDLKKAVSNYQDYIEQTEIKGEKFTILKNKPNSSECSFWDREKGCTIYQYRPFDCRMFPFDLYKIDGTWHWIVYNCNPNSDWTWTEKHLSDLERSPGFLGMIQHIEAFSDTSKIAEHENDPGYEHTVLREVQFPKDFKVKKTRNA